MIDLVWTDQGDRIVCGRYRILRRPDDHDLPWRLDALAPDPREMTAIRVVETARCHTLISAQRTALDIEKRRARTLRASIHAAIALACAYVFAFLAISPLRDLPSVVVAVAVLGLAVRSIGNAVGAKRRDLWGWQPDGGTTEEPSALEVCTERLVARFAARLDAGYTTESARVRVLPPL